MGERSATALLVRQLDITLIIVCWGSRPAPPRRVGVLRSYWWDHVEERWANGVLLDLLAGELS